MQRILYIIVFVVFPFIVKGQKQAVLNEYVYNNEPEHCNTWVNFSPITKTYLSCCYNGNVYQLKNNRFVKLNIPSNPNSFKVVQLASEKYLVHSTHSLYMLDHGNKQVIFELKNGSIGAPIIENNSCFWFTSAVDKVYRLYKYENGKLLQLDSAGCIDIIRSEHKTFVAKLVGTDRINIYELKGTESKLVDSTVVMNPIVNFHLKSYFNGKPIYTTQWLHNRVFKSNYNNCTIEVTASGFNENNASLLLHTKDKHIKSLVDLNKNRKYNLNAHDNVGSSYWDSTGEKYILGTQRFTIQYTSYIKKYPHIFEDNSRDIFSLAQLSDSSIFVGQYFGNIACIKGNKICKTKSKYQILNGALSFRDGLLFSTETLEKNLYFYLNNTIKRVPIPNIRVGVGFYLYKTKNDALYFGTAGMGLCYTGTKNTKIDKLNWNCITPNRLGDIENILTITEDNLGRIWFGHPKKGIGIYKPDIDSVQLFLMSQNKTNIGAFSSLTDNKGTVWIGTGRDGLYAVDGNKKSISLKDFTKIQHPFFMHGEQISALTIHGNHLIINVTNKTLILDLNQYYKGVINIKYLSEKESNYETSTEQNTLLVAKDSTIWFSTSDMLYQWDFKQWLSIPKDKIKIYTTLQFAKQKDTISTSKKCTLKPTNNSFTVDIDYYHPDLLPRYFVFGLQHEKDTFSFSKPQTNSTLSYTNLQSGNYTFHVKVLELDGTTSYYQYKIYIDTFWWQKWWVISLIGLIIFGSSFLYYRNYQTRKTIEIVAKNKALEIEQLKSNTNLELSKLKVQSLANQIRPHFLLNTLNAIGASIQEEKGENLLDNLANSINLLFNQSISGKQVHSLTQEIQICNNIIAIYKSMYLPNLIMEQNINIHNSSIIEIPFGLLQIPIENALQHGLRNKIEGECKLKIKAEIEKDFYLINITDNGIGRKASKKASNARKHGTGIKNIVEIVSIFNSFNIYKIEFYISDNDKDTGTIVSIKIPKHYNYDINA